LLSDFDTAKVSVLGTLNDGVYVGLEVLEFFFSGMELNAKGNFLIVVHVIVIIAEPI